MPAARSRGETLPKPRPDAYVGLLGLSLGALVIALVFAYLNWDGIKEKPKPVQMPAGGASRAPVTPAPGGADPGATPPGGAPANAPPPAQKK